MTNKYILPMDALLLVSLKSVNRYESLISGFVKWFTGIVVLYIKLFNIGFWFVGGESRTILVDICTGADEITGIGLVDGMDCGIGGLTGFIIDRFRWSNIHSRHWLNNDVTINCGLVATINGC